MGKNKGHVPLRTCISCGMKKDKEKLIRLVVDGNGILIWDDKGKENGRGAYACPTTACWERLKKGNRLNRAFRRAGPVVFHNDLESNIKRLFTQ